MEYLVRIRVSRPSNIGDGEWSAIVEREHTHALGYLRQGHIVRIWRVPGTTSNVGVWQAPDTTELHHLLTTLPLHPHMDVDVECLAQHYLEDPSWKPEWQMTNPVQSSTNTGQSEPSEGTDRTASLDHNW
jgi:muconolactone D-isomerase